jgi:hypothetical protein
MNRDPKSESALVDGLLEAVELLVVVVGLLVETAPEQSAGVADAQRAGVNDARRALDARTKAHAVMLVGQDRWNNANPETRRPDALWT